jgi:hypothetical protein
MKCLLGCKSLQEYGNIAEARNMVPSLCIEIKRDFLFLNMNQYISFLLSLDNFLFFNSILF